MMPEWIIWAIYGILLLAFGGACITVYEALMTYLGCV